MTREHIHTSDAPAPGGAYSQAVVAGGFLYTAGTGPHDPATGEVVGDTVAEQTRQVLRNLGALLAARGLDFSDVVKVTAHLQDLHRDYEAYNAVYERTLSAPYPARTTVGSTLDHKLVEIDMVAVLRSE
ncbi:reactive intermediate/imine deaminase [Planotetraspora thailandica]|uniref:Reactive intermediate/imine deaminase n=1 Tax=Planotetraspora thailandica TaxID=487172 RepID=A0A8J3XWV0_9ACTN|nr:Rid family detoxifying hydrolase [Planotetraspora thailandica]GII52128.1 reactive intermediate/imine deaminase [Planotetraspora thailandica]